MIMNLVEIKKINECRELLDGALQDQNQLDVEKAKLILDDLVEFKDIAAKECVGIDSKNVWKCALD